MWVTLIVNLGWKSFWSETPCLPIIPYEHFQPTPYHNKYPLIKCIHENQLPQYLYHFGTN